MGLINTLLSIAEQKKRQDEEKWAREQAQKQYDETHIKVTPERYQAAQGSSFASLLNPMPEIVPGMGPNYQPEYQTIPIDVYNTMLQDVETKKEKSKKDVTLTPELIGNLKGSPIASIYQPGQVIPKSEYFDVINTVPKAPTKEDILKLEYMKAQIDAENALTNQRLNSQEDQNNPFINAGKSYQNYLKTNPAIKNSNFVGGTISESNMPFSYQPANEIDWIRANYGEDFARAYNAYNTNDTSKLEQPTNASKLGISIGANSKDYTPQEWWNVDQLVKNSGSITKIIEEAANDPNTSPGTWAALARRMKMTPEELSTWYDNHQKNKSKKGTVSSMLAKK